MSNIEQTLNIKIFIINVVFKKWENQENFVFNIFFVEKYGDLTFCINFFFRVGVALNALFMK